MGTTRQPPWERWSALAVLLVLCRGAGAANVPPSTQPPGGMAPSATPQLVLLTFDDSVTTASYARVVQALSGFANPNGHGIKATFFVSMDSVYDPLSIRRLYEQGHEIAVHTMSHATDEYSSFVRWTQEIAGCRRSLASLCALPEDAIVGFRAPFLKPNDDAFRVLHTRGFLYDSSFPEGLSGLSETPASMLWPYTLDGGLAQSAPIERQPLTGYPGLFEVPLWMQFTNAVPVTSMDPPDALSSNAVVALWQENFLARYQGNRAPYGLFLHATSSSQWLGGSTNAAWRIGALREFVAWAQTHPDTWFVTCGDLVRFMEAPVDVVAAATNAPFLTPQPSPFPEEDVVLCPLADSHVLRVCGPCPAAAPSYTNAYLGAVSVGGGAAWFTVVSQDVSYAWCTLTVSNDTVAALTGWRVRFAVAGGTVQQLYDATVSLEAGRVVATAKAYNRQIGVEGFRNLAFRVQRSGGDVGFADVETDVESLGPQPIQMGIGAVPAQGGWWLTWTDNAHLYDVESTTNLLDSGSWTSVTNGLARPVLWVDPTVDARFYRVGGTLF